MFLSLVFYIYIYMRSVMDVKWKEYCFLFSKNHHQTVLEDRCGSITSETQQELDIITSQ